MAQNTRKSAGQMWRSSDEPAASHAGVDAAAEQEAARRRRLWSLIRIGVALALCAPIILAGCSPAAEQNEKTAENVDDPAIVAALNDELMIDPDLSAQNEANSALTSAPGAALPAENLTSDAATKARADAVEMVGGSYKLTPPPLPQTRSGEASASAQLTVGARAAAAGIDRPCISKLRYSAGWAARMPEALPVYPRAGTREAAGADGGCALRAVNFVTPVTVEDVLSFYNSRAKAAGYSVEHLQQGEEHVLRGSKGGASYALYARSAGENTTMVDLVTKGG